MSSYHVQIHFEGGGSASIEMNPPGGTASSISAKIESDLKSGSGYLELTGSIPAKDGKIKVLKSKVIGWSIEKP